MAATQQYEQLKLFVEFLQSEVRRLNDENATLRKEVHTLRQRAPSAPPDSGAYAAPAEFRRAQRKDNAAYRTNHGPPMSATDDFAWDPAAEDIHNTDTFNAIPQAPSRRQTGAPRGYDSGPPTRNAAVMRGRLGRALAPGQVGETTVDQELVNAMPEGGMDIGFINEASAEELDALPYGLIVLDRKGNVLFYNETESSLTGFARTRVEGRNFFRDVAPCTRVKGFEGRFRDFVAGKLGPVTFFDFVFRFERGTQYVTIGLSRGRRRGTVNVMMRRRKLKPS